MIDKSELIDKTGFIEAIMQEWEPNNSIAKDSQRELQMKDKKKHK